MSTWLEHHGILGQKWGIRRFQNPDGTYTAAGKKRQRTLEKAAEKADRFSKYAEEDKARFSGSKKTARDAEIAEGQIKRYAELAKKYTDMSKRVGEIDKKSMKEAEQFVKKAFFTNADLAYYKFDGKWHNYEDDDNKKNN